MTVNRRDFVATVGMSLLGSATAHSAAPQAAEPRAGSYSDWSQVRAQFDLAPGLLHFSQFYLVSHPRPVRQLAPSLVNDEGEVEAALKAVRAIV